MIESRCYEFPKEVQEGALHSSVTYQKENDELPSIKGAKDPIPRASSPSEEG